MPASADEPRRTRSAPLHDIDDRRCTGRSSRFSGHPREVVSRPSPGRTYRRTPIAAQSHVRAAEAPSKTYGGAVRTPGWRWCVALSLVGVLISLPSAVGAWPAQEPSVGAATLLARVRVSDEAAWSGYGEVRGDLVLPDVPALEDLPELISGRTRLRAWWRGPAQFRVDALSLANESDVVVSGGATWTWESGDRIATLLRGDADVRLPRAADLVAPALGARLARSAALVVEARPARRLAGRDAAGLRLRPADPSLTTVDRIDLWVEPATGLALRVEVHARGGEGAALTSVLLDVDLSAPPASRTRFAPPPDARVDAVVAPDIAAAADRFSPYRLPATVAGLPRRTDAGDQRGVATYGSGLTALTVVPLRWRSAGRLLRALEGDVAIVSGEAEISTALVQGRVTRDASRGYLLIGTVPQDVISTALSELRRHPPARRTS